ncbi:MAG: hypothetical protein H0V81_16325, partial [Solirubrobacterales bacterium]|nr:hypothetical protein [Solirubrobacterales bacterium]
NFNATTANPRAVVTAGILSQSNSKDDQAILTAANMAPGDTETGTLDLGNTGDLPASMSVSTAPPVDTPASTAFSSYLRLEVDDLGSPTCTTGCPAPVAIFRGPLAQAAGTSDLRVLQPGEKRRYRFKVTYPDGGGDGADNEYGGARTTVGITWTARQ